MEEHYRRFHSLKKCLVVEVCEGDGSEEFPHENVYYVYDEEGNKIGNIEREELKNQFSK